VKRITTWRRSATALAAAAGVASLVTAVSTQATASAATPTGVAPLRTATLTSYNTATFLQDDLGLPTSDTSPVIQPVTYDELQWLLQQPGNEAILIGDPGLDTHFKAEAQAVEAQALTDNLKEIYWFDPNLSGGTTTSAGTTITQNGTNIYEPNLDIRNPLSITSLTTPSQVIYGYTWENLVGQYLGDGVTAVPASQDTENATVTGTTGTATVNDYGVNSGYSTEIVNGAVNNTGGALYNYPTVTTNPTGTPFTAPTGSTDSYFFIYNDANTVTVSSTPQNEKILAWVDLDKEYANAGNNSTIGPDVNAALEETASSTLSTANLPTAESLLTDYTQFDWWESEATAKNDAVDNAFSGGTQATGLQSYQPLLTSASSANGGWRIDQIPYPELVDLLKSSATTNATAVILFGGTWCPNTRPIVPYINEYAQENNAEVFNFDTVLDGGTVGGGTTSSTNPLQSRNTTTASNSAQSNPTFLYGDLVNTYLKNINTQYTAPSNDVTYYSAGNTSSAQLIANKLQVPFLIGYQQSDGGGVNRQWIINNGNGSYTEYMSDWDYTNPVPNELGLSTIPLDVPIWSTLNAELANVTWQTNPTSLDPNTTTESDDAQYLDSSDSATVTYTPATTGLHAKAASVTVTSVSSGTTGALSANPTAITQNLPVLSTSPFTSLLSNLAGSVAPVNLTAAKSDVVLAEVDETNTPADATADNTLIADLDAVIAPWGVAENRKSSIIRAWGTDTSPGSVLGGLAADNAASVFFAGLPGPVVSTQTVSAPTVSAPTAPEITISIANAFGATPTGDVSLVLQQNGTTVGTASEPVVNNVATFTLPTLAAGTYNYTLSYAGDSQIVSFSDSGTLTVSPQQVVTVTQTVTTPAPSTKSALIAVSSIIGEVFKSPTPKKSGEYEVAITSPSGDAEVTGEVTVTLKKGSSTKVLTGKISGGIASVKVPKLGKGTWKVTISWPGDTNYSADSVSGPSIKVK